MNHYRWTKIKKWLIAIFVVLTIGFAGGYEQSETDDFGIAVLAVGCGVIAMTLAVSIREEDF